MTIQFQQVDWTTLIPTLVGLFFSAIGAWINSALHAAFDGIWGSGANVLTQTPMDMTWSFGPISTSINDVETGSRAVLIFALVLLGIRGMLGAIVPSQPDMLGDGVNGILGAIVLTAAFPVLIPEIIGLVNQAARSIAVGSFAAYLNTGGVALDPLIQGVLYVVLLFFVFRLLLKAVWRIGFLAVLLPVGMAACILSAVPQLRWILGWWARTWGGMLAAQLPSTLALAIGLTMAGAAGAGLSGFVYSIAFLQLAHDLYDIVPFGMARAQSSPIGAVGGALSMARLAAGFGGGGVSAAATAAGMRQLAAMDRASSTEAFYSYD